MKLLLITQSDTRDKYPNFQVIILSNIQTITTMTTDSNDAYLVNQSPQPDSLFADETELYHDLYPIFSSKWHIPIVNQLIKDGPLQFSELNNEKLDITSKMLSCSLEALQEEGIINRHVKNESPKRIEYTLTKKGEDLAPIIERILRWGNQYYYTEHSP